MSRKFFSSIFAACISIACLAAAPVVATAYAPIDPGVTATEPIKLSLHGVEAVAVMPADTAHRSERERLRPTVAVYNLRTCQVKTPDGSGRLREVSSGHRAFAVPWLRCGS